MAMRRSMLLMTVGVLLSAGVLAAWAHENPDYEPVTVLLTLDKTSYRVGEPVRMSITACNRSSRTVTLFFHTYQLSDAAAYDGYGGKEVWRWSSDKFFAQALTSVEVAPGCTWTVPLEWSQRDSSGQPVPPGFYLLRA